MMYFTGLVQSWSLKSVSRPEVGGANFSHPTVNHIFKKSLGQAKQDWSFKNVWVRVRVVVRVQVWVQATAPSTPVTPCPWRWHFVFHVFFPYSVHISQHYCLQQMAMDSYHKFGRNRTVVPIPEEAKKVGPTKMNFLSDGRIQMPQDGHILQVKGNHLPRTPYLSFIPKKYKQLGIPMQTHLPYVSECAPSVFIYFSSSTCTVCLLLSPPHPPPFSSSSSSSYLLLLLLLAETVIF